MKFFTNTKGIKNNFALIRINQLIYKKNFQYNKLFDLCQKYKEVILDVGVYQLKKQKNYSFESIINFDDLIDLIPKNCFIPFDYPSDMNLNYQNLFISKSWDNALKYHSYSQFITTIQHIFNNYQDFLFWFDKYNNLNPIHYLGLGNLCRINRKTEFLRNIIKHTFKKSKCKKIHIFGLSLRNIEYVFKEAEKYKIDLSIDNCKWTKASNSKLKAINLNVSLENRQFYFNEYMKTIQYKKGVYSLEY